MNADGSGERMVASNAAAPSWSPDGVKIAFLRGNGRVSGPSQWDLYLMTADGGGQRRLTRNAWLAAPVWSPNGRKIAFVRQRAGNNDVHVMNANGSGERNLTRNPAGDHSPTWSPDGRKIAFVRNFEIYVMNADGSGQQRLTRNTEHDFTPAWSPDGQRIAFERRLGRRRYGEYGACGRASIFEVHVVNADGSGQRHLTRTLRWHERWFAWLPGRTK
jgi:Tol biopolymer transport system component